MNTKDKIDHYFSPRVETKRKRNIKSPSEQNTSKKIQPDPEEMEVNKMNANQTS
jgi:hypothetical protein